MFKKGRAPLADQMEVAATDACPARAFDAAEAAKELNNEMTLALARIEALDHAGEITSEDMRIHISV